MIEHRLRYRLSLRTELRQQKTAEFILEISLDKPGRRAKRAKNQLFFRPANIKVTSRCWGGYESI